MVKIPKDVTNTLDRLRLRRKYACTLVPNSEKYKGMIKKVRCYIAYGKVDEEFLSKIIEKRGQLIDKKDKIDGKKMAKQILDKKSFEDTNLKPFFRLHPPRKGIKSKLQYPKGVLGNNKEDINKLIERML